MGKHRAARPVPKQGLRAEANPRRRAVPAAPPLAAPPPSWLRRHGPWLALLCMTLLAYLPALRNGYIWDDQALSDNPLVASPAGLFKIWFAPAHNLREAHYWPLVYSTFWVECRLWGLAPLGYHLDNILLHALCAVLLWRLLRRLAVPGAWLAAALFALHPVHVESVAWAVERKDVLYGAFYLGGALAWLRYERTRRPAAFLVVALLCACAMFSKSMAVTFPAGLALLLWWRDGRLARRDLIPLALLGLLALALMAVDMHLLSSRHKAYVLLGLSVPEQLQVAAGALWFYLGKLAWPAPLATFYPQWRIQAVPWLGWLPLLAALGLAAALWVWRGRLGRGPLAATLFFGISLAPVLGIIPYAFFLLSWVADRFQYLASIGPLVLAAALLARMRRRSIPFFRAAAGGLLLLLSLLTWRQAGYYKDATTIFQHTIDCYPANWAGYYELGLLHMEHKEFGPAEQVLKEAARRNPDNNAIFCDLARAQLEDGKLEESSRNYQTALRLSPNHTLPYNDYGTYLGAQGKYDEAIAQLREGLKFLPNDPDLLANLASACIRAGRTREALEPLQQAVRQNADVAQYHLSLGWVLSTLGRADEAIGEFEAAFKLHLEDAQARADVGVLLVRQGKPERAITHLEQALRLGFADATLHFYLGEAYRQTGRRREAAGHYDAALRLRPGWPEAAQRKAECAK